MPAFQSSADLSLELQVTIEGSYSPADPDVGAGRSVEDIEIEDVFYEYRPRIRTSATTFGYGPAVCRSILQGVDHKHPEVQKLLSNILDILGDESCAEALEEANVE